MTHRDIASSIAIVTGHTDPKKKEPQVKWSKLASSVDTIIILMGVENIKLIAEKLFAGGMKKNTPIASIFYGTTDLQKTIVKKASLHIKTIMPGFTHLQSAQIVSLAHHLMAYYEMLKRDKDRFLDSINRMNECPLGSAALAGTSFNIDRGFTSKKLGFKKPTSNSMDSVSDRDYALEFLSNIAICGSHLSRFGEDITCLLYTSPSPRDRG